MTTKTIKGALTLTLLITFIVSCTTENIDSENIESEAVKIEKKINSNFSEASKEFNQKKSKKEANNSSTSSKLEGWTPDDDNGNGEIDEETPTQNSTMEFIVEFTPGLTSYEKQVARDRYSDYLGLQSYVVCSTNPDKEIWTLDTEIYNDDTTPAPLCPGCSSISPGNGEPDKDSHVQNDPDFSRAVASITSTPCHE